MAKPSHLASRPRKVRTVLAFGVAPLALMFVVLAAAIALGGPGTPAPMASINNPFRTVDFSALPEVQRYAAADGETLAYRRYAAAAAAPRGSVVLIHGSSAAGNSMHPLARSFATAGYEAYALDMRGHGASGTRGRIGYIGQLEDDVAAFMHAVAPARPAVLVGFSAGGGFALRFAGSPRRDIFQAYLLLSPFLGQNAPNFRPSGGGWVSVGIPRIVALVSLNAVGVRVFNDLPVTRFALNEQAKAFLTPEYSYSLAMNFRPRHDYEGDIRAAPGRVAVLAGTDDEAFRTDQLEGVFRALGKQWPVTLLPGLGHVGLTLDPAGIAAAIKKVEGLRAMSP